MEMAAGLDFKKKISGARHGVCLRAEAAAWSDVSGARWFSDWPCVVEQNSDRTGSLLWLEIPAFSRRRGVFMGSYGLSDRWRKGDSLILLFDLEAQGTCLYTPFGLVT
jgi:hypothetical protein